MTSAHLPCYSYPLYSYPLHLFISFRYTLDKDRRYGGGRIMFLLTFRQEDAYCLGIRTEKGILDVAAANRTLKLDGLAETPASFYAAGLGALPGLEACARLALQAEAVTGCFLQGFWFGFVLVFGLGVVVRKKLIWPLFLARGKSSAGIELSQPHARIRAGVAQGSGPVRLIFQCAGCPWRVYPAAGECQKI